MNDFYELIKKECEEAEKRRLALYLQLWHMIDLVEKNKAEYDIQPLKEAMARLEFVVNDLDIFRSGSDD